MKKLLSAVALAAALAMPATAVADDDDHESTAESETTGFIAKLFIGDPDLTVVQNGPLRVLVRCEAAGSGALASLIVTSDEPFVRGSLIPALTEITLLARGDSTPASPSQALTVADVGFTSDDGSRAILFVRDMPFSFFHFGADCTIHGEAVELREDD